MGNARREPPPAARGPIFGACCVLFHALASAAVGQTPPIGTIDFYGLRSVTRMEAAQALGLKEGDSLLERIDGELTLRPAKPELVARLESLPGVVRAHVEVNCCEDGRLEVYVGIQEAAGPAFSVHSAPDSSIDLPQEIIQTSLEFEAAIQAAVLRGDAADDMSQGHSLFADSAARFQQLHFLKLADQHLDRIRRVLRYSADGEQRAIAAMVLGYAADKRMVLQDLLHAVRDHDEDVRNNATRALSAIAFFANDNPQLGIEIPPGLFVEMLSSLVWSDRNKAMSVLRALTAGHEPRVLEMLREALPSLVEMARWKGSHSLGAFLLLAPVAGLSEEKAWQIWNSSERDSLIASIAHN